MSKKVRHHIKNTFILALAIILILLGASFVWVATLEIPTLDGFANRKVSQSTKIYDRTGKVLLFDLHQNIRRTIVPLTDISVNLRNATIAIEDQEFYSHHGIKPLSILRALLVDIKTGSYSQGGSTITQQVVKNTLLTSDKKISRKVKEWILALKIERILTKDQILNIYLNEAPYGGNIYGAEEASQRFFGVSAKDLTLSEAAYMAALPQSPTRLSPYGGHLDLLEKRKNNVLYKMLKLGFITSEQYSEAKGEKVVFEQYGDTNIKAPHFVFYVQEYLEKKYGRDAVYEGGLKVITTLNYKLQKFGEEAVSKFAYNNQEKFNAKNAALVAIDPKTGQILTMVGSRNYFDTEIDGKFNIATTHRQPGSTFKPIVYVTAFEKGYTPETVLFDVPTQFSVNCKPDDLSMDNGCYAPQNYDNGFRGPITLRSALAQSINIPAIKTIYLVGVQSVLDMAHSLGITSLQNSALHYGLPLALGGGEVSLLELTNVYATFGDDGIHHPTIAILSVEDSSGKVLEKYEPSEGKRILQQQPVRLLNDVLSDSKAREPEYPPHSFTFNKQKVAVKTGTTNGYRDVWVMGYTPNIAIGMWGGNNDNSAMVKKISGLTLAPTWIGFMNNALSLVPRENFLLPDTQKNEQSLKPVLRGFWQGDESSPSIHSILYWVNKNNPRGAIPTDPSSDPEYNNWEYSVLKWVEKNSAQIVAPNSVTQINPVGNMVSIISPKIGEKYPKEKTMSITISLSNSLIVTSVDYYLNTIFMGTSTQYPYTISLIPKTRGLKNIKIVVHTKNQGIYTASTLFSVY